MKPTLLIMAAGLGSRYGGLKQIDPVGPHGEILLEFALKDALSLGIEEVVVIVSETIRADFESMIVTKYPSLKITLVTQTLTSLPSGVVTHPERVKPWGTAHAVWCAREVITWPFIVMNADDFYGRDALEQAYNFLAHHSADTEHCIITYPITSTLSEYGTVSRGICAVEDGKLTKIVEHTKVARKDGKLVHTAEDGHEIIVPEDAPANMNLFGFHKSFFEILDRECQKFFGEFGQDLKREFFLPSVVMQVIKENAGTITAISTTSPWFGMTYPEDRLEAKNKIQALIDQGPTYNALMNNRAKPEQLFQIGIKWLVRNTDGLYLCLKSSEGYFDLPGGRIADWENIPETLKHELWEEAGLSAESFKIASEWKILWTDKYIKSHPSVPRLLLLIYVCELNQEISIQLSHEHTAYSWETARDLYEKVTILQDIRFETLFE